MKAKSPSIVVVLSLLAVGLACCSWSAQDAANGKITICAVQAVPSRQIVLTGKSTLPDGTCLHTQLFTGRKPEAWWPTFACASIRDGTWQMVVPLGCGGAPDEVNPTLQYTLCAWQRGDPTAQSLFEVDWVEPSTPEQ